MKPVPVSAIEFYNHIADEYDNLLNRPLDVSARQRVHDYVRDLNIRGVALDFGGGSGLDLPWLTELGFDIYFCEPAFDFKNKAVERVKLNQWDTHVHFVDNEMSDFHSWTETLPFRKKPALILANFGVANYIKDLTVMFQQFDKVSEQRATVILLLLVENKTQQPFLKHIVDRTKKIFSDTRKRWTSHKGKAHAAYIYSTADLVSAAMPYFSLHHTSSISGTHGSFEMLHFVKK